MRMRFAALAVLLSLVTPAEAETFCGHEIKVKGLIMDRASKWYAGDKRAKKALGSFITECEKDGLRVIVSSPDGKPDNPHIGALIYAPKPN